MVHLIHELTRILAKTSWTILYRHKTSRCSKKHRHYWCYIKNFCFRGIHIFMYISQINNSLVPDLYIGIEGACVSGLVKSHTTVCLKGEKTGKDAKRREKTLEKTPDDRAQEARGPAPPPAHCLPRSLRPYFCSFRVFSYLYYCYISIVCLFMSLLMLGSIYVVCLISSLHIIIVV